MLTAHWNTGWLIGMAIVIVLQFLCLVAGTLWAIFMRDWVGPVIAVVCILVLGAIGTVIAFPFAGEYHRYQPISGTVQSISSRFLGDGSGGTNQNFVVTINNTAYRVDDTRASLLHKGSKVTLLCELNYQFNAAAGWVCNWGKFGLNK